MVVKQKIMIFKNHNIKYYLWDNFSYRFKDYIGLWI